MSKRKSILVLFLLFSLGLTISCGSSGDDETEKLRKEVEEMKKEKTDQEIADLKEKVKDQEEETEKDKPKTESKTKSKTTAKTFPITDRDAEVLINSWEDAQKKNNYNEYKSFYSPQFTGIKRTSNGKTSRMNYRQWLNDRQPMLKNIISFDVSNLNITIVGNTATAQFTQDFESNNYQDTGQKILKIQMFSDGTKIIYEEMKSSN